MENYITEESTLPGELQSIRELIGFPGAMLILEHFGGTRVCIPKKIHTGHKLVDVIGMELARKLSTACGGSTIPIPLAKALELKARNAGIVAAYTAKTKVAQLARGHKLTERQIYTILSRAP